ncbi:MAG: glycerol kinase GlpK [Cyanophyceae cyanobacterium]
MVNRISVPPYVMALDLGTTGNRAFIFDATGAIVAQAYRELPQIYPRPGWVEHDPQQIWADTLGVMQSAVAQAGIPAAEIAAIGLTVQRETCLVWNRRTGRPLYNAIVWQDRRTAPHCEALAHEAERIYQKTGLVLDAYFSATKLAWLRQHVVKRDPSLNEADLLAGTIDTWILWNLTGGAQHLTDHSNASRTMLYNLTTQTWDPELLELFDLPATWLPQLSPSLGLMGHLHPAVLGARIPITAVLGDQQAALLAHGCDRPGLSKCTYGTGAFLVAHTGSQVVRSSHRLLSTVAWTSARPDRDPLPGFALEGSMFTTGSCIQWLRDGLKIIQSAAETDALASSVADTGDVYFVPALSGLGAPHWDMSARASFMGITGGTQREHLVRAVLESIAYQVADVVAAINQDQAHPIERLKVDGGSCQNDFLMQFQADVLGIPVERPAVLDATAQGAAFAAGLVAEVWPDYASLIAARPVDRVFEPGSQHSQAQAGLHRWHQAVERAKHWAD